jgi:hypothetical protein
VAVIRVARKASGYNDECALERGGNAHLHSKLVGVTALAFGDSFNFWGVPAVKLGLFLFAFVATSLSDQAFGFMKYVAQRFLHSLAQRVHLSRDLTLQAAQDCALTFEHFAHLFELSCVCITTSLVAQKLAFLGIGLLEVNAMCLGSFNQFDASRLQQFAVCGVGNGLLLNC